MALTRQYESDFTQLVSTLFTFTVYAPNGDTVVYPNLNGEQAEQLWRMYRATGSQGWDIRWIGNSTPQSGQESLTHPFTD